MTHIWNQGKKLGRIRRVTLKNEADRFFLSKVRAKTTTGTKNFTFQYDRMHWMEVLALSQNIYFGL